MIAAGTAVATVAASYGLTMYRDHLREGERNRQAEKVEQVGEEAERRGLPEIAEPSQYARIGVKS